MIINSDRLAINMQQRAVFSGAAAEERARERKFSTMEISIFPSHLPKQQLRNKDVAGRVTVPTGRCSNNFAEYSLKSSTYVEFDKFRPLRYSNKHGREEISRRLCGTIIATYEVEQVVHMLGGTGENSYAKNSRIQAKGILKAKPVVEAAVKKVYRTLIPKKFVAVDLACSTGPNTFLVISEITTAIDELCRQLDLTLPEIQIFLNDLPRNDFNNIFCSLMDYRKQVKLEKEENFVAFYVAGLPGSFYTQLFPSKSVHFFHSSYGQMWLSQVPRGVDGKSDQLKKENLYSEQFKEDFTTFLTLRSKELIYGGRMVITVIGRRDNSKYKDGADIWGLLTVALNEMISEGLLRESDRNAINFPIYTPSIEDLIFIIQNEGSFHIDRIKAFKLSWDPFEDDTNNLEPDYILRGKFVVKYILAIVKPLLDGHLEKEIIDELSSRYAKIIATHLKQKPKMLNFILDLKLKGDGELYP